MALEGFGQIIGGPMQAFGLSQSSENKQHLRNLSALTKAISQYQQENDQARMNAMREQLKAYQPLFKNMDSVYGKGTAPDISGLLAMTSAYPNGRESLNTALSESNAIGEANKEKSGPLGFLSKIPIIGDLGKGLKDLPLLGDLF
jgi:hypothetical protein